MKILDHDGNPIPRLYGAGTCGSMFGHAYGAFGANIGCSVMAHGRIAGRNAAVEEDIVCLDCHEPTIEQQVQEVVTFVKKEYRDPLKQREFENEFCLECHGSYKEIALLTADYDEEQTPEGEYVNPHDPPMDMEDAVGQAHFECYNCHSMHRDSTGLEYCYDACHMSNTLVSCDKCHENS